MASGSEKQGRPRLLKFSWRSRKSGATSLHAPSDSAASPTPTLSESPSLTGNCRKGLRILHQPRVVETDIIFIHGLTGDSHDTWVSNSGVYWPTQLLAKDLPNCRIMTFGYDADVVKLLGPVSQNRVRDHAADLIGDLASIRGPDNTASTPIIFVVHSLGGLVAKKALCLSEQAIGAHEQQLHNCAVALAFLGTPHRGSGLAPFAAGVAQILKAAQKRVNTEILSLLQRDSEVLADVDAAFGTWLRKRGSKVQVTCFSEAYELPGIGLVVSRESSQITGYPCYSIPANHMDMVRFSSPDEIGYRRVRGELERWVQKSDIGTFAEEDIQGCLRSLAFPEMEERFLETMNNIEGTCTWLNSHPVYHSWLANDRGLLWIKGKPGAGKSTLMKFAVQQAKSAAAASSKVMTFFFHGRGTELQKSSIGLFRAIAHQIGMVDSRYIKPLVREFRQRKFGARSWTWTPLELENHLVVSILPAILSDTPVRIFIDALDECGDAPARMLVESLGRIQRMCLNSRFGLSMCFACRHYPIIAPSFCQEIWVENENERDIFLYIQKRLEHSIPNMDDRLMLGNAIEIRSQHVSQWVVLVVPKVIWLWEEGNSLKQLLGHIERIPEELHLLYGSILQTLTSKQPSRSMKLFQWVCFGFKALSLPELRWAMNVDARVDRAGMTLDVWTTELDYIETDDQMKRLLPSLSGGLVELTKFGIQLIHQSVQDFLFSRGFAALDLLQSGGQESYTVGQGHSRLARSCLVYYLAIRRQHLTSFHSLRTEDIKLIADKNPLLTYSLRNWLEHARLGDSALMSQANLIEFLPGQSNHCLEHWELMSNACLVRHPLSPNPGTTLLHEAAKYSLYSLIPVTLDHMSVNVVDALGRTPISIAAQYTGSRMVQYLLSCPGIDINKSDAGGRTPLAYAIETQDLKAVDLVLGHHSFDAAVNLEVEYQMEQHHGSAICHAIRHFNAGIIARCLSYPSQRGLHPRPIIKALIQTCRNHHIGYGHWYERHKILEAFEATHRHAQFSEPPNFNEPILFDQKLGQVPPLFYLCRSFSVVGLSSVLSCFHTGFDINIASATGQRVLHVVVITMSEYRNSTEQLKEGLRVITFLLGQFPSLNVNLADGSGLTPLEFAISHEDLDGATKTRIVEILLSRQDLDINRRTTLGVPPVCRAAQLKLTGVVELLLSEARLMPAENVGDWQIVQDFVNEIGKSVSWAIDPGTPNTLDFLYIDP